MANMKFVRAEPVEQVPRVLFDRDDVEIVAEHYDFDYAECYVKNCGFNNNLTTFQGYCLVENDEVIMNLDERISDWRDDVELFKKFYSNDMSCGFIDSAMSFDEYFER